MHEYTRTRTSKNFKVLLVGETLKGAAPLATLARVLMREGIECLTEANGSLREWIRVAPKADVIICGAYNSDELLSCQLALAVSLGKPVVRRWAGTDVWNCLNNKEELNDALKLDKLVSLNLTPSQHLVDELQSIGLCAQLIPLIVDIDHAEICVDDEPPPRALLVYLPSTRYSFFRRDLVEFAIQHNPEIRFIVIADTNHSLASYPNVISLGWVDDLKKLWPRVGGLLRLTKHDGMPRMLIECLARGKHAIYSRPFRGSWLARNELELEQGLSQFKKVSEINHAGLAVARSLLLPSAGAAICTLLEKAASKPTVLQRIRAASKVIQHIWSLKVPFLIRRSPP